MATTKKAMTKKGGEYDPICEAIARDKSRPKSMREIRDAQERAAKKQTTAKKK